MKFKLPFMKKTEAEAPETIKIVTVTNDKNNWEILTVTKSTKKANRRIEKEVKDYIASWHQGRGHELKTKKQYYADGWCKPDKSKNQIRRWLLDETEWFTEFAISEHPVN